MELSSIVPLDQGNVELFRVFWPPDPNMVQARPGLGLAVMVRSAAGGGVLVAIPASLVPAGTMPLEVEEDAIIGPNTRVEVAGVRMLDYGNEQLGIDLDVQLVDIGIGGLAAITPLSLVPATEDQGLIGFGEDLEVIPDPTLLVEEAMNWLRGHASQRVAYYSAEEGLDGHPLEEEQATATLLPPRTDTVAGITPPATPKTGQPKAKEAGIPKDAVKPKRVTTAQLSDQLGEMMALIPALSSQIAELQRGHQDLQLQIQSPPPRPTQMPISGKVGDHGQLQAFAKMMGPPPKTKVLPVQLTSKAPTITSGADANVNLQELTEEASPVAADPFTRVMLEQSKALMTLVAHMQQGSDPLLDGQGSSSSGSLGTRGSQGREKLQRELSAKSGSFFLAVAQNAAKRLKPAAPRINSIEELASSDFSMIHYLERFGGYGSYKELGLIQALAHIFDALVHSDLHGAQDYLALLMTGVDQANLDGNRWELAYRMMLLEEPPSQLWAYRTQGFDPRARSFSPLAPQSWTTTALAFSKEMDYIQNKRIELTQPKVPPKTPNPTTPNPKRRGRFPKAKASQDAPADGSTQ